MGIITGSEKAETVVGKGINLLTAERPSADFVRRPKLFDMSKIDVEGLNLGSSDKRVIVENSKVNIAKAFSLSAGLEASAMGFSSSVKTQYESSHNYSEEQAFTQIVVFFKKRRHFFADDTYKKYLNADFKKDLNGTMAPSELFKKYGTHYIKDAGLGGTVTASMTTNKTKSEDKESLKVEIQAAFGKLCKGSLTSEEKKSIEKVTERSKFIAKTDGGKDTPDLTLETFIKEFPGWVSSLSNKDTWRFCFLPIDDSLGAIWDLCEYGNSDRRKQLKKWYDDEAKRIQNNLAQADEAVTNIRIFSDKSEKNAKTIQKGWNLLQQDLNEGAGGNYIYLSYKTSPASSNLKPITNLLMVRSDKALKWTSMTLCDGNGISAKYYRIDEDLNKNAKGKFIYLCYTCDNNKYPPLVAISTSKGDDDEVISRDWESVTWNNSTYHADANNMAKGKYIYILQKHSS